jgi:hypothetical protein
MSVTVSLVCVCVCVCVCVYLPPCVSVSMTGVCFCLFVFSDQASTLSGILEHRQKRVLVWACPDKVGILVFSRTRSLSLSLYLTNLSCIDLPRTGTEFLRWVAGGSKESSACNRSSAQ